MTFSRKLFISVFLSSFVVGSALIWGAYNYASREAEEKFRERYSVFSRVLGGTLSRLDGQTEALMLNAAKVVVAADAKKGLLSAAELRGLRDDLKMTHIFVIESSGKFVRSTNEDPALIPNLFSFSPEYRRLIDGTSRVEATPIIQPKPEPLPYKFLSVPSVDKRRIIEVGIRVDFIGKALAEAAGSDPNTTSMALYSPDGAQFGKFGQDGVVFGGSGQLPTNLNSAVDSGSNYRFFTKVRSSHSTCSQCDISGTSRGGEYYYVLETEVSKAELIANQNSIRNTFLLFGFGNLLLTTLFSGFLTKRLSRNIRTAVRKVRSIKDRSGFDGRIGLTGEDDVVFLTQEFDRLLDTLQESQRRIVESETNEAKVQLAREIAHNMRSPALAMEMALPMLTSIPAPMQKVLRDSVEEIRGLAEKLRVQAEAGNLMATTCLKNIGVAGLVETIVDEKRIELSAQPGIEISCEVDEPARSGAASVDPIELRALLSNVINNAVEAYPDGKGAVSVVVNGDVNTVRVGVEDSGKGIPATVLSKLGHQRLSWEKTAGSGLGLMHAQKAVSSWGGSLKVESVVGSGTNVSVSLPRTCEVST